MAAPVAWVLNLDADVELASAPGYEPGDRLRSLMRPHVERLSRSLLGEGDRLIDETSRPASAAGCLGRAFSPTPRAVALLIRAGAEPEPYPDVAVLRRVNSRAFASSLGETLPGAAFVTERAQALAILEGGAPPIGTGWRVKHAFGMSGRNQRVVRGPRLTVGDLDFVGRGLRHGGLQIEPDVEVTREVAIHGLLGQDGGMIAGSLVRQRCDARGAWISTEPVAEEEASGDVAERMRVERERVASALRQAGYFGPFGIDGYTYRGPGGAVCLQPRSEINARYSMGFAVGMGQRWR